MDLGLLAVAERLLVGRARGARVRLDLDVEDGRIEALGRAERGEDNRRLERLGGCEQLDGDVLMRLQCACQHLDRANFHPPSPWALQFGQLPSRFP